MDFRKARLDEIMHSTDLLEFEYKAKKSRIKIALRMVAILIVSIAIFTALPLLPNTDKGYTANGASPTVTATAKAKATVQLRKSPSTSAKSLGKVKKNTKLIITAEVFTSKTSTKASTRWYAVKVGKKSGYIKANKVKSIKYAKVPGITIDELNYRVGAGTQMKRKGTLPYATSVTVCLPAKAKGSKDTWYRVLVGKKAYYVIGNYLNISNLKLPTAAGKAGISAALLSNPTRGGKARIIGTLSSENCTQRFSVTGHGKNVVPQGLAYTGDKYHIIFGMDDGQSIVTYSANGQRLSATNFGYNMGHPNSLTWDPITKLCYIFKGYEYKCHYWNPATNQFGTVKTPYSSSGVSYDAVTNELYVSSQTGIRVYTADGLFTHKYVFDRCSRGGINYMQDCGAYGGYIFHGVSGANRHTTNYLDVYRATDAAYLGSFKVTLGEIESVVVNNNGYVELLINHAGTYNEYIWKTPINVKDLMK